MKRWPVALSVVALALAVPGSPVGAAQNKGGIVISRATVTAAKAKGDSAIVLSITNNSSGVISLLSVTSPDSKASMIDYDTNMCQGNHAMMEVANILITAGHKQELGYKYQGAMLRELRTPLVKGQTVPLVITWSDFQKVETATVEAKVVAPPRHLDFGMTMTM